MVMGARLGDLARQGFSPLIVLPSVVSSMLYFTFLEGRFGCGLGKAVFNLRVVDESQAAPGLRRELFRALVFLVPAQIVTQVVGYLTLRWMSATTTVTGPGNFVGSVAGFASVLTSLVCLAILFLTARRANGFAAMHDLASGTRVVLRPQAIEARQAARSGASDVPRTVPGDARIGPYVVASVLKEQVSSVATAATVEAYDDRLRRGVWMELLPIGTPAVPAQRRDLGRPARARWLSGRRSATECWDAYEAIDGQPFLQAIAKAQPWARVRHWVADLARELTAGLKDGSLPSLHVDRIWIGSDDRARLLDWPAPGCPDVGEAHLVARASHLDFGTAQQFLYGVAAGALRGVHPDVARTEPPSTPISGPARALLLSLRDGAVPNADLLGTQVSEALRTPAAFPGRHRLLQLAACGIVPLIMSLAVFATIELQIRSQTADPDAFKLKACLQQLVSLDRKDPAKLTAKELEQRDAIEIYIADHLRGQAEETASYALAFPASAGAQRESTMAQQAIARHPSRSPEQIKNADAVVAGVLASTSRGLLQLSPPLVMWGLVALIAAAAAGFVAVLALIGAVFVRGGFTLRALGATLVTSDGRDVTRTRAVRRWIVTWSPLALSFLLFKWGPAIKGQTVGWDLLYTLPIAMLIAGAVWAWLHPSRGIQDRIVGTWIVPR